jgi:hypothetical protein
MYVLSADAPMLEEKVTGKMRDSEKGRGLDKWRFFEGIDNGGLIVPKPSAKNAKLFADYWGSPDADAFRISNQYWMEDPLRLIYAAVTMMDNSSKKMKRERTGDRRSGTYRKLKPGSKEFEDVMSQPHAEIEKLLKPNGDLVDSIVWTNPHVNQTFKALYQSQDALIWGHENGWMIDIGAGMALNIGNPTMPVLGWGAQKYQNIFNKKFLLDAKKAGSVDDVYVKMRAQLEGAPVGRTSAAVLKNHLDNNDLVRANDYLRKTGARARTQLSDARDAMPKMFRRSGSANSIDALKIAQHQEIPLALEKKLYRQMAKQNLEYAKAMRRLKTGEQIRQYDDLIRYNPTSDELLDLQQKQIGFANYDPEALAAYHKTKDVMEWEYNARFAVNAEDKIFVSMERAQKKFDDFIFSEAGIKWRKENNLPIPSSKFTQQLPSVGAEAIDPAAELGIALKRSRRQLAEAELELGNQIKGIKSEIKGLHEDARLMNEQVAASLNEAKGQRSRLGAKIKAKEREIKRGTFSRRETEKRIASERTAAGTQKLLRKTIAKRKKIELKLSKELEGMKKNVPVLDEKIAELQKQNAVDSLAPRFKELQAQQLRLENGNEAEAAIQLIRERRESVTMIEKALEPLSKKEVVEGAQGALANVSEIARKVKSNNAAIKSAKSKLSIQRDRFEFGRRKAGMTSTEYALTPEGSKIKAELGRARRDIEARTSIKKTLDQDFRTQRELVQPLRESAIETGATGGFARREVGPGVVKSPVTTSQQTPRVTEELTELIGPRAAERIPVDPATGRRKLRSFEFSADEILIDLANGEGYKLPDEIHESIMRDLRPLGPWMDNYFLNYADDVTKDASGAWIAARSGTRSYNKTKLKRVGDGIGKQALETLGPKELQNLYIDKMEAVVARAAGESSENSMKAFIARSKLAAQDMRTLPLSAFGDDVPAEVAIYQRKRLAAQFDDMADHGENALQVSLNPDNRRLVDIFKEDGGKKAAGTLLERTLDQYDKGLLMLKQGWLFFSPSFHIQNYVDNNAKNIIEFGGWRKWANWRTNLQRLNGEVMDATSTFKGYTHRTRNVSKVGRAPFQGVFGLPIPGARRFGDFTEGITEAIEMQTRNRLGSFAYHQKGIEVLESMGTTAANATKKQLMEADAIAMKFMVDKLDKVQFFASELSGAMRWAERFAPFSEFTLKNSMYWATKALKHPVPASGFIRLREHYRQMDGPNLFGELSFKGSPISVDILSPLSITNALRVIDRAENPFTAADEGTSQLLHSYNAAMSFGNAFGMRTLDQAISGTPKIPMPALINAAISMGRGTWVTLTKDTSDFDSSRQKREYLRSTSSLPFNMNAYSMAATGRPLYQLGGLLSEELNQMSQETFGQETPDIFDLRFHTEKDHEFSWKMNRISASLDGNHVFSRDESEELMMRVRMTQGIGNIFGFRTRYNPSPTYRKLQLYRDRMLLAPDADTYNLMRMQLGRDPLDTSKFLLESITPTPGTNPRFDHIRKKIQDAPTPSEKMKVIEALDEKEQIKVIDQTEIVPTIWDNLQGKLKDKYQWIARKIKGDPDAPAPSGGGSLIAGTLLKAVGSVNAGGHEVRTERYVQNYTEEGLEEFKDFVRLSLPLSPEREQINLSEAVFEVAGDEPLVAPEPDLDKVRDIEDVPRESGLEAALRGRTPGDMIQQVQDISELNNRRDFRKEGVLIFPPARVSIDSKAVYYVNPILAYSSNPVIKKRALRVNTLIHNLKVSGVRAMSSRSHTKETALAELNGVSRDYTDIPVNRSWLGKTYKDYLGRSAPVYEHMARTDLRPYAKRGTSGKIISETNTSFLNENEDKLLRLVRGGTHEDWDKTAVQKKMEELERRKREFIPFKPIAKLMQAAVNNPDEYTTTRVDAEIDSLIADNPKLQDFPKALVDEGFAGLAGNYALLRIAQSELGGVINMITVNDPVRGLIVSPERVQSAVETDFLKHIQILANIKSDVGRDVARILKDIPGIPSDTWNVRSDATYNYFEDPPYDANPVDINSQRAADNPDVFSSAGLSLQEAEERTATLMEKAAIVGGATQGLWGVAGSMAREAVLRKRGFTVAPGREDFEGPEAFRGRYDNEGRDLSDEFTGVSDEFGDAFVPATEISAFEKYLDNPKIGANRQAWFRDSAVETDANGRQRFRSVGSYVRTSVKGVREARAAIAGERQQRIKDAEVAGKSQGEIARIASTPVPRPNLFDSFKHYLGGVRPNQWAGAAQAGMRAGNLFGMVTNQDLSLINGAIGQSVLMGMGDTGASIALDMAASMSRTDIRTLSEKRAELRSKARNDISAARKLKNINRAEIGGQLLTLGAGAAGAAGQTDLAAGLGAGGGALQGAALGASAGFKTLGIGVTAAVFAGIGFFTAFRQGREVTKRREEFQKRLDERTAQIAAANAERAKRERAAESSFASRSLQSRERALNVRFNRGQLPRQDFQRLSRFFRRPTFQSSQGLVPQVERRAQRQFRPRF